MASPTPSSAALEAAVRVTCSSACPLPSPIRRNLLRNEHDVLFFDGLGGGIYSVYALDTNGCPDSSNIVVAQPTPFNLYAQAVASTTCPDTEDGTVVLNFFGGSGNGTTYSTDGMMYSTENTFTLAPGNYTFYAQDVNGCPDTLSDVEVVSPSPFESLAELVSPTCFGDMNGSITVDVQGGTAPLTYVVNGDSLDMVMLNMVTGGDYAIEVVDANGCLFDASVTLSEPAEIVPAATVTDVLCNGDENGGFVVNATGGSGMGYTYDVDNGGFGPNAEYTGLAAGTYTVTVQDDAECSGSADIVVGTPDAIEVTVDANGGATGAESDGALDITVTGVPRRTDTAGKARASRARTKTPPAWQPVTTPSPSPMATVVNLPAPPSSWSADWTKWST